MFKLKPPIIYNTRITPYYILKTPCNYDLRFRRTSKNIYKLPVVNRTVYTSHITISKKTNLLEYLKKLSRLWLKRAIQT